MKKRLFAVFAALCMVLSLLPTVALAEGGYGENELPAGPDISGAVINVNAENAQYVLDGAYGSIDGKTINFTESINTVLHIGRPTKYGGSNTSYYVAGFTDTVSGFRQFDTAAALTEYKSSSGGTPYCYYSRTISNVKFTSDENVTLAGFDMSGATGHNYGPGYDFVRDKALTNGTNDGYYGHININGLTFEGLTINNTTDNYAINFYITSCTKQNELQNIAFNNCSISSSKSGAASFMNNGGTADIYKGISFNGCTLNVSNSVETNTYGVLTLGVGDLTVNGCRISGMTRAVQTQSASSDSTAQNEYGKFIVTNNTFDNVKTYVIKVAATSNITGITITGNTSTNSASGCQVRLEPAAYGGSGECVIRGNTWDSNIGYKYDWNKDAIPVAQIDGVKYGTLAAAIAAAQDGDTVTLLKDVDLGSNTLTINKKITLDGGAEKHSITSTVGGAVVDINTSERVTIQNLKIFATASGKTGRGIGISNTSAKIDVNNVEIETTQRGITVNTDTNNGIELNLESCLISLVEPGQHASEYNYDTTVLSTNNYNNSRGISLWDMANSTVTLKNTTVRGFYYSINNSGNDPATGSNGLVVSAEDCTFKGRAAVNQHNAGVTYTLTNCDITGINNYSGSQEGFACIVLNQNASDNSIAVNGGTVRASFNDTGSSNINATQFLVDDRAGSNTVTLNNVTYTCPTEYGNDKGGIVGKIRPGTVITVDGGNYTMPEIISTSYSSTEGEVGTLNILGGNFAYNTVSASIEDPDVQNALNISGGTFSSDPTDYVTDGKIAKKNSETEYAVIAKNNLTSGVYMSDPNGATAANYYATDNGNGTWTVFYVAPYVPPTSTTETTTNENGSTTTTVTDKTTGTVTETTTSTTTDEATGTTTETKTETVTAKDGTTTSTETVTATDASGSTGTTTTTTNANGETTVTAEAAVSAQAITEAAKTGEAVTLPVEVPAAASTETAAEVTVSVPAFAGSVSVEIPVTNTGAGVVAVKVNPDGTEEIIKTSVPTENGVVLNVEGEATIKIVDNSKDFTDVKDTDWHDDAVAFVSAREIMNGVGGDKFDPNTALSRGMIAQVLHNFENNPETAADNLFDDVSDDAWYTDAVKWAADQEIIEGSNGNYAPDDNITREQLAAILYRYAGAKGYDVTASGDLNAFTDGDQTASWAQEAMEWAVASGIFQGNGNSILNPKGSATRAEIAQILMNFCKNVVK